MCSRFSIGTVLALAVLLLTAAPPVRAEGEAAGDAEPNPFQKTYVALELTRDWPEAGSQAELDVAPGVQPGIAYVHDLDGHWLMGLGGQYRLLARRPTPDQPQPSHWLALLTLYHETLYALRLTHPVYLLLGPKLLYMLPALNAKIPPDRTKDYLTEEGGGLVVELVRVLGDGSLLTLRAERWRGTSTQRLQGTELAVGYAYAWK